MLWRQLFLAVACVVVCPLVAQNNSYKINDELYNYYIEAFKERYTDAGLEMSKTMYNRAAAIGDRKAQCIALTIPIQYYYHNIKGREFEKALYRIQKEAQHYGYMQYYYYGSTQNVLYLIKLNREEDAFNYTIDQLDFARKRKDAYGIFTAFNNIGYIHLARLEVGVAAYYYRQALDIGLNYLPDQDMAVQYRKISDCYRTLFRYDDMLYYAKQGLKIVKNHTLRQRLLQSEMVAEFALGRYDDFKKHYNAYIAEMDGKVNLKTRNFYELEIYMFNALIEHNWEDAEYLYSRVPAMGEFVHVKKSLAIEYYRFKDDYIKMAQRQDMLFSEYMQMQDSVRSDNYALIGASITNLRIQYENKKLATEHQRLLAEQQAAELSNANLELANTQLTLRNSSLELSRTNSAAQLTRLNYQHKQLENERLRKQLEASRASRALETARMVFGVAFGVILAVAIGLYLRSRARLMAQLKLAKVRLEHNHTQLAIALEQAQAADRAKNEFIRNMDQSIKQPLERMVKAAQIISNAEPGDNQQQLAALSNTIQEDTDKMLGLVGDVLEEVSQAK